MFDDEESLLSNICGDLLSLKKFEAFLIHLFLHFRSGTWVSVADLCQQDAIAVGEVKPDLFVTWLAYPNDQPGYAIVVFYDDESKWSMTAQYNRQRLISPSSVNATQQASNAAGLVPDRKPSLEPKSAELSY